MLFLSFFKDTQTAYKIHFIHRQRKVLAQLFCKKYSRKNDKLP